MLSLAIVLMSMMLGVMLFFSGVLAPTIFIRLPSSTAGRLIRHLFPSYYAVGILVTLCAASVMLLVSRVDSLILFSLSFSFLLIRQLLMPQINKYRDLELGGDIKTAIRFKRLHKLSVILNAMQILVLSLVIIRLAGM